MSNIYKENGAALAGVMLGVDYADVKGASEAFDVESSDKATKENAINFYKKASSAIASHMLQEGNVTEDFFVLKKLASTDEWCTAMVDYVDEYFVKCATDRLIHKSANVNDAREHLVKMAGPGALAVGGATKAMQYTPSLFKALLALGVVGGTATGGLYWGLNRHLDEDSSIENDLLNTQVDEYHKMRKKLKSDIDNTAVKSLADSGKLGNMRS